MRATSKHLQIQGRSAKRIFILQMHRNILSLFKRFGRQRFQNGRSKQNVTCYFNRHRPTEKITKFVPDWKSQSSLSRTLKILKQ